MKPKWFEWATRLQSIAQAGLTFSSDKYDLDRFEQIRALSVKIMNEYTGVSKEKIKTLFAPIIFLNSQPDVQQLNR
jgi:hypothetical protein